MHQDVQNGVLLLGSSMTAHRVSSAAGSIGLNLSVAEDFSDARRLLADRPDGAFICDIDCGVPGGLGEILKLSSDTGAELVVVHGIADDSLAQIARDNGAMIAVPKPYLSDRT